MCETDDMPQMKDFTVPLGIASKVVVYCCNIQISANTQLREITFHHLILKKILCSQIKLTIKNLLTQHKYEIQNI